MYNRNRCKCRIESKPPDVHVGSDPLHRPFAWHVRLRLPIRIKPKLQLYSAVDSNVVPTVSMTDPSAGSLNSPQSMATKLLHTHVKYELNIQYPVLWCI